MVVGDNYVIIIGYFYVCCLKSVYVNDLFDIISIINKIFYHTFGKSSTHAVGNKSYGLFFIKIFISLKNFSIVKTIVKSFFCRRQPIIILICK